jgi:hypothetical protein
VGGLGAKQGNRQQRAWCLFIFISNALLFVQGLDRWPGLSGMAMAFVEGSPTHAQVRRLSRDK